MSSLHAIVEILIWFGLACFVRISICIVGGICLLVWGCVVVREKYGDTTKQTKRVDRTKDEFFEIQSRRAVRGMAVCMILLTILWLGWSIVSTDAVYSLVKDIVYISQHYTTDRKSVV